MGTSPHRPSWGSRLDSSVSAGNRGERPLTWTVVRRGTTDPTKAGLRRGGSRLRSCRGRSPGAPALSVAAGLCDDLCMSYPPSGSDAPPPPDGPYGGQPPYGSGAGQGQGAPGHGGQPGYGAPGQGYGHPGGPGQPPGPGYGGPGGPGGQEPRKGLSGGIIAGIVGAVLLVLLLCCLGGGIVLFQQVDDDA